MKLTEMLMLSPEQFKETFLSSNNRDENYPYLYSMFDSLSVEALADTPFVSAVRLLSVGELVDLTIYFLKKSHEERAAGELTEERSYRCIWRFVQLYYLTHHGAQKFVVEGVPIAFNAFREMDLRDLYHIMRISDESEDLDRPPCIYLQLFKPELELYDHVLVKKIQRVALEESKTYLNKVALETDISEDEIHMQLKELKEKVEDPKFTGMIYMNVKRVRKDDFSELLGDLIFGSNKKKRKGLDELFDSFKEEIEEEPTKH